DADEPGLTQCAPQLGARGSGVRVLHVVVGTEALRDRGDRGPQIAVLVALVEVHPPYLSVVILGSLRASITGACDDGQVARPSSTRRRDPDRRARILEAAARLTAARGFHNVGMAEIGAEAGIVGSGIYRHFASKDEILVVLLEEGMARLQRGTDEVIAAGADDHTTMSALVRDHITVAIEQRSMLAVYHREQQNLPEEARR